ncbi:MAG: helix-turn-helix transcriptional regulator [Rhodospirillales bacterium]
MVPRAPPLLVCHYDVPLEQNNGDRVPTQENLRRSDMADRLRRVIELSGGSIRDFAEAIGVPYRTVQEYIAGRRKPSADQLVRMADGGVDIYWLLTGHLQLPGFGRSAEMDAPETELFGADSGLLSAISKRAFEKADDFQKRHLEANKPHLTTRQALHVWSVYYALMIMAGARMIDNIAQLRQSDVSVETIAQIFAGAITEDHDARVYATLENPPQLDR